MAATDFNDRIRFGSLYEIYGALLTEKQRQCLELYFCEDYSLAEVAEEMQVSRQAIHDLLKRVEQTLEHYEEMLGFLQRMEKTRTLFDNVKPGDTVAIFIGPEGGFDDSEINLAKEAGFEIITLGKRILRTETAGLMVLSNLMMRLE